MVGNRTTRAGMTLLELLMAVGVISAGLGLLVTVSESLRTDNAETRTRDTLAVLRAALVHYHRAHQQWPTGATGPVLTALAGEDAVGDSIRSVLAPNAPADAPVAPDGYGRPIRYFAGAGAAGPDFVSAGADGRFGDPTASDPDPRRDAADNLYGADTEAIEP